MIEFFRFLDDHNGSFMVIITFIYVIATIAIWKANSKSAKATQEQIEESKKQFEETNRLACIPYLQIEKSNTGNVDFEITLPPSIEGNREIIRLPIESPTLIIKNVGNGSATNINFDFSYDDSQIDTGTLPINAIMKGDRYFVRCILPKEISKAKLKLYYNDYIGNEYTQIVTLSFYKNYLSSYENDMPRLLE